MGPVRPANPNMSIMRVTHRNTSGTNGDDLDDQGGTEELSGWDYGKWKPRGWWIAILKWRQLLREAECVSRRNP